MRTPSIATVQYIPGDPGDISSLEQLTRYVRDMEQRVSLAVQLLALGHLDVVYTAPNKPRDGDIRYADGTSWNPGSGRGVYVFKVNTWAFLG